MTKEDRDFQQKHKALRHAEKTGQVAQTCRYFGVGRSSFYRWKTAYEQRGEAGLINRSAGVKEPRVVSLPALQSFHDIGAQQLPGEEVWVIGQHR